MNTVKNDTINHFQLKWIDVLEVVNRVCVPDKTEDLNLSKFSLTTGINE